MTHVSDTRLRLALIHDLEERADLWKLEAAHAVTDIGQRLCVARASVLEEFAHELDQAAERRRVRH